MVRAITVLGILSFSTWAESGPVRKASAPAIINNLMPAFYNGYLYSREPRNSLTLFSPDGHAVLSLVVQGHGGGTLDVVAVAVDSGGALAIAWNDTSGAGIDIRDSFGSLVRTIDTGRYVPAHLSFGEDHLLWSLGWQRDADTSFKPDKVDYSTVLDEFPGVVLTSDDRAYVHRHDREARVSRVFRLNRAMSIWEPVDAPGAQLYGADGENLVFAQWTRRVMNMSWYPQPQISSPAATTHN